jgi:hypothetical protein
MFVEDIVHCRNVIQNLIRKVRRADMHFQETRMSVSSTINAPTLCNIFLVHGTPVIKGNSIILYPSVGVFFFFFFCGCQ